MKDDGGKWVISGDICSDYRATEPDETSPASGSGPSIETGWYTWNGEWVIETSVSVIESSDGSSWVVAGSTNQPDINGVYTSTTSSVFENENENGKKLYWIKGKWVISDDICSGYRALEPDETSPASGSGPSIETGWYTWNGEWVIESSVRVTLGHSLQN